MINRSIWHNGMLVVTNCSGTVTSEELNNSETWMIRHFGDLIKPGFCQLFDTTEADTHKITDENIHHIAYINISFACTRGKFKMAILANYPYTTKLAMLHKILSKAAGIDVEIFKNENEAYIWLGYDNPTKQT